MTTTVLQCTLGQGIKGRLLTKRKKVQISQENKNDHKNTASIKSDKTQYDTDTDIKYGCNNTLSTAFTAHKLAFVQLHFLGSIHEMSQLEHIHSKAL